MLDPTDPQERKTGLALRLIEEYRKTSQGYHVPALDYDWFTVFLEPLSLRVMMVGEAVKVGKLCRLEYWAEYKKWKKNPQHHIFLLSHLCTVHHRTTNFTTHKK